MLERYLPILQWLRIYNRGMLTSDLVAAVIVTIMLIPQSLAYALLAGLPPEVGLYASILPLVAYAVFGTSRTLAVGPVAVVSLMTAAAVGNLALAGTTEYLVAATALAFLSGVILILMGLFRLGILANFLSHPVISGFITASGLIIAASQLKHIMGVSASGHNLLDILLALAGQIKNINLPTLIIGVGDHLSILGAQTAQAPVGETGTGPQAGRHRRQGRAGAGRGGHHPGRLGAGPSGQGRPHRGRSPLGPARPDPANL